jgi:hypothetical protein
MGQQIASHQAAGAGDQSCAFCHDKFFSRAREREIRFA